MDLFEPHPWERPVSVAGGKLLNRRLDSFCWPHAPAHRLSEAGTYMVTAGTYLKQHHFRTADRLDFALQSLLGLAGQFDWRLEAWAVFSNHYHFVAHSPPAGEGAVSLSALLQCFHECTAKWVNRMDGVRGRRVWFNFWETRLTFERSYFARLCYVHQNPVRHRLVKVAALYPWCSAGWFEREARTSMVRTIYGVKTDRLRVLDGFEPVLEE